MPYIDWSTHAATRELPIVAQLPALRDHLRQHNTLLLSAPPGAGKSTLLPLALLEEDWLGSQKILMLEPRRLAAKTIATRMAQLLGEEVGQTVGYRIRFEQKISKATRIEVLTEGILTRMLQSDNALEGVGLLLFDEFHERSIFADVALALSREAQQVLRSDLRMVIMSATLNVPHLAETLQAPVLESQGRQYPVTVLYGEKRELSILPEVAARAVHYALQKDKGDLLVFLPGEAEIRRCESLLRPLLPQVALHPLYGQLPFGAQQAALVPDRQGRRKVVLATDLAETSLTIEGVQVVIDSGYARTLRFDPGSGLSRLTTVEISRDRADQRAGRAGRLGPGKCYRLWSKADDERLAEHRLPEIADSDLAPVVLDLARWGIKDPLSLSWPTPPPPAHLAQARDTLSQLGALENDTITPHGKAMALLPCHPRLAHMLLKARESHTLALAVDLAAVLEERDPLSREAGIDINLRIEKLRRMRAAGREVREWTRLIKVADAYARLMNTKTENGPFDAYDTGLLLVHAFPERIASARPGNNAQFQLSNGSCAMVAHTDDLAHEAWLAVAHLDAREGTGKIFLAAPLNPRDLAPMVKTVENIAWETRKGGLIAAEELRIGGLVLQTRPLKNPCPEQITAALCRVLEKEGAHLLDFNEEVTQWQNRVQCLARWRPKEDWPDVSTTHLLKQCREWLAPYLNGLRKNEELKKINLKEVLHYHLSPTRQKYLDHLAPERLPVPSGSLIKLSYQSDGSAPVLAVRLQELFGLAETPTVNEGRQNVLLHLLSPGFKPVQVTSDLQSFWNNTYFEVRKELRNRYPKHVWPDDPWTEQAIRGTRRRPTR